MRFNRPWCTANPDISSGFIFCLRCLYAQPWCIANPEIASGTANPEVASGSFRAQLVYVQGSADKIYLVSVDGAFVALTDNRHGTPYSISSISSLTRP